MKKYDAGGSGYHGKLPRMLTLSALFITLLGLILGAAHAARLPLTSANLGSFSYAHPCPGTAVAAPGTTSVKATSVKLSLPSQGCSGMKVTVSLHSASGSVLASGSAEIGAANAEVPVGSYVPSEVLMVQVEANGWVVPTSWSYAQSGPVYEASPSTVITSITWTLVTNNPVQACFDADVTTESLTPVEWRLTTDLSKPPFNGAAPTGFQLSGPDGWRYQKYAATPGEGFMQIGGTANGGRLMISKGTSYRVSLCNYSLPPGVQTPSAYNVDFTQTTWTPTQACIETTVKGNGSERFYFSWAATLDMREARKHLEDSGHPFSAYTYGPDEWKLNRSPDPEIGPDVFKVTSKSPANLSADQSFTFVTCAVSYN